MACKADRGSATYVRLCSRVPSLAQDARTRGALLRRATLATAAKPPDLLTLQADVAATRSCRDSSRKICCRQSHGRAAQSPEPWPLLLLLRLACRAGEHTAAPRRQVQQAPAAAAAAAGSNGRLQRWALLQFDALCPAIVQARPHARRRPAKCSPPLCSLRGALSWLRRH